MAFADDLAAAFVNVITGLAPLMPMLAKFRRTLISIEVGSAFAPVLHFWMRTANMLTKLVLC